MYGRRPRLPADIALGLPRQPAETMDYPQYITRLQVRLHGAFDHASRAIGKQQADNKVRYDAIIRGTMLKVGDRALDRLVHLQGKQKLADRWDQQVYTVVEQPNPTIPVFVVRPEVGQGRQRTLHINLLMAIGDALPKVQARKEAPVAQRRRRSLARAGMRRSADRGSLSESDGDSGQWVVQHWRQVPEQQAREHRNPVRRQLPSLSPNTSEEEPEGVQARISPRDPPQERPSSGSPPVAPM